MRAADLWVMVTLGGYLVCCWPILLQKSAVSEGSFGDFAKDDRL